MFGLGDLEGAVMESAVATMRVLRDVLNSSGDPEAALLRFASSASDQEVDLLRTALAKTARRRR